eukprot:jgi/Botrbrau1/19124/Bobra.0077s0036.1
MEVVSCSGRTAEKAFTARCCRSVGSTTQRYAGRTYGGKSTFAADSRRRRRLTDFGISQTTNSCHRFQSRFAPRANVDENGSSQESSQRKNTEFGYSRKDVLLIGFGLIAFGYVLYYGLQAAGLEAGLAGNWVQLIIFLGICVGWVGSYLFRVANKEMTYVKQLEDYELAVMQKRIEEMPETERESLLKEIEEIKAGRKKLEPE